MSGHVMHHMRVCARARETPCTPGGPLPEPRILTEENAVDVLNECMDELGTLFGSNAESRSVGITGAVSLVELDGPGSYSCIRGHTQWCA